MEAPTGPDHDEREDDATPAGHDGEHEDGGDNDIAFMYREGVLGKDVWIKFPVKLDGEKKGFRFFQGKITRMETSYPNDDTTQPLEYQHFIFFGDQDDGYYDLTEQEMSGYLKWAQKDAEEEEEQAKKEQIEGGHPRPGDTAPSSSAAAAATVPLAVTPEKKIKEEEKQIKEEKIKIKEEKMKIKEENKKIKEEEKKRKAANESTPAAPKKIKQEARDACFSRISNIDDPNNDEINLDEFTHWLTKIHRSRGTLISDTNAKNVLNRVRDLVDKRGISYIRWKRKIFYRGKAISLKTDFNRMLQDAKDWENNYGKDKGHGWVLTHPIKKLQLYKEYVEKKRYERKNPILIS
jgi:hypothetical protein